MPYIIATLYGKAITVPVFLAFSDLTVTFPVNVCFDPGQEKNEFQGGGLRAAIGVIADVSIIVIETFWISIPIALERLPVY